VITTDQQPSSDCRSCTAGTSIRKSQFLSSGPALVNRECCRRLRFEVEVLCFFDSDGDTEGRSAFELSRRFVLLADGIATVASDAETVAVEREFSRLGAHGTFRDDLAVHVEFGLPSGLVVLARAFAVDSLRLADRNRYLAFPRFGP